MTQTCSAHFTSLGMTPEKYALLNELAESSDYWTIALVLMKAAANLELGSLSSNLRRRLTSMILELDCELYDKSWGLDKIVFKGVKRHQMQADEPESSFDKMRRMLRKETK